MKKEKTKKMMQIRKRENKIKKAKDLGTLNFKTKKKLQN